MTKRFETALSAYLLTLPAERAEVALAPHLRPEGEPARYLKYQAGRELCGAIRHAHTLMTKGKLSVDAYASLSARYDAAIHA